MDADTYLYQVLNKYAARDLSNYSGWISNLKGLLVSWASGCYVKILDSGSHAKGTAISLASDVDFLVSLTSGCNQNNGGLKGIYNSLHQKLSNTYSDVRKQNVSVRVSLGGLQVDVTPARMQDTYGHFHSIYLSKLDTWKQTNIQKHISDISTSGRTNEIKILKIWRQLYNLDFPSIYLEYLIVSNILWGRNKGVGYLASNVLHIFSELASDNSNPLFSRVSDPANTNNILSDLLSPVEKSLIIKAAKVTIGQSNWNRIVW
jgi:hypothetical protein